MSEGRAGSRRRYRGNSIVATPALAATEAECRDWPNSADSDKDGKLTGIEGDAVPRLHA